MREVMERGEKLQPEYHRATPECPHPERWSMYDSMTAEVEVLEFPELGMEAIWRIEVENFPAFIVMDDKGNDFYDGLG